MRPTIARITAATLVAAAFALAIVFAVVQNGVS